MTFQQKLDAAATKNNSLVCVGLDSDIGKIPEILKNEKFPQYEFNKAIIDATYDLVCAYKPNSAFYEAGGAEGVTQLKMTCDYIRYTYPTMPIIIDAKRGDIGNTNEAYMHYVFDYLGADAITLQPYLGGESLAPFLQQKEKGIIILCRTSNPGAGEFQDMKVVIGKMEDSSGNVQEIKPLYQIIAENVVNKWNINNNCMLVVGATFPEELKEVRKIVGDMTILVPGVGSQGGDIEAVVKNGLNFQKKGIIINAGRSIIFAAKNADFAGKARIETVKLQTAINNFRK
jgi:orotidine-5'-phosphate decarboxylase